MQMTLSSANQVFKDLYQVILEEKKVAALSPLFQCIFKAHQEEGARLYQLTPFYFFLSNRINWVAASNLILLSSLLKVESIILWPLFGSIFFSRGQVGFGDTRLDVNYFLRWVAQNQIEDNNRALDQFQSAPIFSFVIQSNNYNYQHNNLHFIFYGLLFSIASIYFIILGNVRNKRVFFTALCSGAILLYGVGCWLSFSPVLDSNERMKLSLNKCV